MTPPAQIDVIYLTPEQLRSDENLKRVDTFLRSGNNFLGGFSIYSVGLLADLDNHTQTYTIIYENGQNLAYMFKVFIEGSTNSIRVLETQRLQLTSSLRTSNLPYSVVFLLQSSN